MTDHQDSQQFQWPPGHPLVGETVCYDDQLWTVVGRETGPGADDPIAIVLLVGRDDSTDSTASATRDELRPATLARGPVLVEHDYVIHAAHYEGGGGHDLVRWIVRHPVQPTSVQLAIIGVPVSAEFHSGYRCSVDELHDDVQHWVYAERRQMFPGTCDRCAPPKRTAHE